MVTTIMFHTVVVESIVVSLWNYEVPGSDENQQSKLVD